jgi:predicted nucleic acid-binding protein
MNRLHPVALGTLGVTPVAGEAETIAVSLESPADLIIMDESSG